MHHLDLDEIYTLFVQLSGLNSEEGPAWKHLCQSAAARLAPRLHDEALQEENRGRVEFLAAAYAARLYDLIQSGGPDEVKLGDVSLSGGGGSGSGALLAMAYALAADCLTAGPGPGLAGCP